MVHRILLPVNPESRQNVTHAGKNFHLRTYEMRGERREEK